MEWDIFISHASEDKEEVAKPLARLLQEKGLKVWYDEFELKMGDSLSRSIDQGLAKSKYGVVILSNNFLSKEWPQRELQGLAAREIQGIKVILPVWHNITLQDIIQYSPVLADRLGISTKDGLGKICNEIVKAVGILDNTDGVGSTEQANMKLSTENSALRESLLALDASQEMIFTLTLALESKDQYTRGHSERVAEYALAIAEYLKLGEEEKVNLWHAAILHDIGKIGIPDSIPHRSSSVSEEDWLIMRSHSERGETICSKLKFAQKILPIIRHHHERYDGKGYPDGLKGENIPLLARIVTIADMVDAVTSERPFRSAQTLETALVQLEKNAGTQFDPSLVMAFIALYRKKSS